ncbi:hypothetical protein Vafri_13652, partial [Volvox africanus]
MYEALTRKVPFDELVRGPGAKGGGAGSGAQEGGLGPGGGMPLPLPMGGLFAIILAVAIQGRRPLLPDWIPRGLADLISACWSENPRIRPTAAQVYARLDSLIAEELGRRAVRAARVGAGRPRTSRRLGVSGAMLVPAESASSSAGGPQLPSPPPSPAGLKPSPGAPTSGSQSSCPPPAFSDSGAGGGKSGSSGITSLLHHAPAPTSGEEERYTAASALRTSSSTSSAAAVAAAAAAAKQPLKPSSRTRSGSDAGTPGDEQSGSSSSTPPLQLQPNVPTQQGLASSPATGRPPQRPPLPRPPLSPPASPSGYPALLPEPMPPRLELPPPAPTWKGAGIQPSPPELPAPQPPQPPPPQQQPPQSPVPDPNVRPQMAATSSMKRGGAGGGSSGRSVLSLSQMAAAVFAATTGGKGSSSSWFGGNVSGTASSGEETLATSRSPVGRLS